MKHHKPEQTQAVEQKRRRSHGFCRCDPRLRKVTTDMEQPRRNQAAALVA